jgi:hypothetical protein
MRLLEDWRVDECANQVSLFVLAFSLGELLENAFLVATGR